ncbi:hypothetical protein VFPPC_17894 [Pochonia chlamydosporia 170]|uniref:Uncharacterized protein n=1 Tax=Pochonia chlamydosporia 170 TaxID=1380566 RepID=A0A219AQ36_METCM|nr:hypothetical protein VFPPC_17894 [Pochonia chlamydosporia 170]OWT42913.1 hypothetical protein VFPPC_17894 [Pochonia chlamydosporia 170]
MFLNHSIGVMAISPTKTVVVEFLSILQAIPEPSTIMSTGRCCESAPCHPFIRCPNVSSRQLYPTTPYCLSYSFHTHLVGHTRSPAVQISSNDSTIEAAQSLEGGHPLLYVHP